MEDLICYLDDFFFCSLTSSEACKNALAVNVQLYAEPGLPVAPDKVAGPSRVITFLGIELDLA